MSSESSTGASACHGPTTRSAWIYTATDGFQAQIGETSQCFRRLPPVKLSRLVHSDNVYNVPSAPPHLFYHAQLLHYGLAPSQHVLTAVATLKAAFARAGKAKKLKVPNSVYAIKQALKAEYGERVKLVKNGRIAEIRVELKEVERKQAALKKEMQRLEGQTDSSNRKERHIISIDSSPPPQQQSANATVPALKDVSPDISKRKALDNTTEDSVGESHLTKRARSDNKGDEKKPKLVIPPKTSQAMFDTTPPFRKATLAAFLYGKWRIHGNRSGILENLNNWIGIGKQFAREVGSQGYGQASDSYITAFVGRIELSDFRGAFYADHLARNTELVGGKLRVTFTLRSEMRDSHFQGVEGKVILDFDGDKLEGTISHAGLPKPILFQGYNRTALMIATDSSNVGSWWIKYQELKGGKSAKRRDAWFISTKPSRVKY